MSIPLVRESSARFNAETRDQLRLVARYQRWVLLSLLAAILLTAIFAINFSGVLVIPVELFWIARVVHWCLCICMSVSVVLLSRQIYNLAIAIICGVAMFIPVISLLVLLIVNGRATRHLQEHHVKVGLLGANPKCI